MAVSRKTVEAMTPGERRRAVDYAVVLIGCLPPIERADALQRIALVTRPPLSVVTILREATARRRDRRRDGDAPSHHPKGSVMTTFIDRPSPLAISPTPWRRDEEGRNVIVDAKGDFVLDYDGVYAIRALTYDQCDERARAVRELAIAAPALRDALKDLVEFAWTAVHADCEEARLNLNEKLNRARAVLEQSGVSA
jgi:hypothetical protein